MGEKTLKQIIINKLDDQRGLASQIAQEVGYSSSSALRKVLLDEKKEFEKFYGLVKLVNILFPKDEVSLMCDYAMTLDVNKQTARYILEYLDQNRQNDTKRRLIEKMSNSTNSTSKEFAKLYMIDDQYLRKEISVTEAMNKYGCSNVKSIEVQVGMKIFKAYCLLDEQAFGLLNEELLGLDMSIMKITDDYIREMYYSRVQILSIAAKVSKNRIDEARDIAKNILLNITDNYYLALAYLHLGNSYLFEGFDTANEIYNKGLALCTDSRCETVKDNLQRSSNFLHSLYGKTPLYLNVFSKHPSDVHEVIFYYIKSGNKTMARKMIDQIDMDNLNNVQKGFNHFYRGLLDNSIKSFSKSIVFFKLAGEFHFRKFPILELEKLNIDSSLIEALAV